MVSMNICFFVDLPKLWFKLASVIKIWNPPKHYLKNDFF